MTSLYKKYSSVTLASRPCPYARVRASWCAENGWIDPGLMRPGIVRYYIETDLRKADRTVGVNCNIFSNISSGTA